MNHDHAFGRAELRHGALQFQGLVDGSLHEQLDFWLPKCCQHAAPKTSDETLSTSEADAVALVGGSVEHFDSGGGHHAHQFPLPPAFVVMVSKDGDNGNSRKKQQ